MKAVIVINELGVFSEVWVWRQIRYFNNIEPFILTWKYRNKKIFPIPEGCDVKILEKYLAKPEDSTKRWTYRLKCVSGLNFYNSVGTERRDIAQWLDEIKPDVILAHFGMKALRMLTLAKNNNIPIVAHFHGSDLSTCLNNRWYKWSLLNNLHKFSAVVVVGSHQKQWMLVHGVPERKVHLIPCGVPTCEFVYPNKKTKKDFVRFLAVSRLVEKKGLEYSIHAFSIVKEKFPTVKLDIFGDGPLDKKLKEQVNSMGLADAVRFMGSVSPDYIRKEMALSDVFLQHSVVASNGDMEGFGVSVAEASASGLPLVCSNATGIIDQVVDGETGFLVEQKDIDGMASAMLRLARDKELRRKMGRAGRERMEKYFDTKKQIAKLEDVLLNCVKHD